jgi:hypothetical protein
MEGRVVLLLFQWRNGNLVVDLDCLLRASTMMLGSGSREQTEPGARAKNVVVALEG